MSIPNVESTRNGTNSTTGWVVYVCPVAVFLILTQLESYVHVSYVGLYAAKIVVVTVAAVACRSAWRDIRVDSRVVPSAVIVGLLVFVEWIALDKYVHYPHIGSRASFNPFDAITNPAIQTLFIALRFFGLALLVPVIEELFWRSFLLRYVTNARWESIQPWAFSPSAFAIMCVAFGLAHSEWLAAIICAGAYGLLLQRTKSVFACVIAHAVTNLSLGMYIIAAHAWRFW